MVNLRTLASLEPGDHLYWAYDTEEEHRALLTPFLRQGLERGEKVIYLADAHSPDAILDYLHDDGLETEPYLASGQLRVLLACDVYLQERRFDVARMLAYVGQVMQRAQAEGYPALRATGEMTWALRGTEEALLIEYESAVNALFVGSTCLGLCQYHRQRFDPELLSRLLAAHPATIVAEALPEDASRRLAVAASKFEVTSFRPRRLAVGRWGVKLPVRTVSDRRALLSTASESCLRLDVRGAILDCQVGQAGGGYLWPKALLGKRVVDVLPPELGLEVQRVVDQVRRENSLATIACVLQTPEGEQTFEIRAMALPEQQAILFLQNTTEQRRAEKAWRFLSDSSAALAAPSGYEATLRRVARLAVPALADGCIVEVAQDRARRRLAVAHVDPAHEELLATIQEDGPSEAPVVSEVLRAGRPRVFREITDSLLAALSRDAAYLEVLRQLGLESAMIVPLRGRGQILGTISFLSDTSGRRYGPADLALAEELAHRCALAIDNALLYRQVCEAVRRRDEFLSAVAHELKTPVTSLRGFAQLILRRLDSQNHVDWARLRRALEVIDRQSERLSRLVLQLLDVSRLEDGHLKLDRQVTDLARLIKDAVAIVEDTAGQQHTFTVRAPSPLPALVDPLRLEQVLINLLEGAVRFGQGGDLIEVEATTPDPATVLLLVQRCGGDTLREHKQRILDRMNGAQPDDHFGDFGLSLCISRRIARQHGGRIEVEFLPSGGARFVVSLPRGLSGPDDHRGDER